MLLKKGIVRKTFLFSVLLVLLILLLSFAVMYFAMPGYYLSQKEKTLQHNLDLLTHNLKRAGTEEDCASLIAAFSDENNVGVTSFNSDEMLLPVLSTPFVSMQRIGDAIYIAAKTSEEEGGKQVYSIQIRQEGVVANPDSALIHARPAQEPGTAVKWMSMSAPNALSLKGTVGTDLVDHVVIQGTLQPIDEAKGVILSLIPYVLVVSLLLGFLLAGIYARQLSKPILYLSDAALKMQNMEPDVTSGIRTNDELGQLSENLDALYSSLRETIDHLHSEMEKVNRLERSKTEMMQSASHELKTPIAALGGMLEGMLDEVGAYKDKEKYLTQCKEQVGKLSYLVGEILGASRADMEGDAPELSDVPVDELVKRAVEENLYQIHDKNLRLTKELPPIRVTTDPEMFYRAVSNLISNAVRYTPQDGEIRVSITEEDSGCLLVIENESEPIPQEELDRLFEPFYTRNYSRDKSKSGTGLGLYIVKRSLERLGIPHEAKNTDFGFYIGLKF